MASEGGSFRILVVEDDDLVRDHISGQLRSLGYGAVSVRNAREAIEALEGSGRFDLLFTDIVMPGGMDGRKLAAEARRLCPGIPVLFTSGYAVDPQAGSDLGEAEVHLLAKPYRRQDLAAKLQAILARP